MANISLQQGLDIYNLAILVKSTFFVKNFKKLLSGILVYKNSQKSFSDLLLIHLQEK